MSILRLTKANCKNCYKCISHCPIKAIEVVNDQAQIIEKDCVLCGKCVTVCPQNAKHIRNDIEKVEALIKSGKKVFVSIAPSFISNYPVKGLEKIKEALLKLGFCDVLETAVGANIVKQEYEKIIENKKQNVYISSCCSTIVSLIQKYYPAVIQNIMPVLSPMQTHAKLIKLENEDSYVVFIGPCFSKKEEAQEKGSFVDAVLTFEELDLWLKNKNIVINEIEDIKQDDVYLSRFFPVTGGIIKTMEKQKDYFYLTVDGLKECINVIKDITNGVLKNCFIEMSACKGSCIAGPSMKNTDNSVLSSYMQVDRFAYSKEKIDFNKVVDFDTKRIIEDKYISICNPSEESINEILKKMGKKTIDDRLNCGFCGYSTCVEKATAVYFKKADITMCLPYMKQKAESFSDIIVNATPNAILTIDSKLEIQQMNFAAAELFNITDVEAVKNTPISNFLDEFDFVNVLSQEKSIQDQKIYLVEYDKVVEQSILYSSDNNIIICIMKDITAIENQKEDIKNKKQAAADLTDKVIQKHMRTVQEIASLLGETTAETKIALTQLKNTVLMEEN